MSPPVAITIDASKTGEPIAKYIYGQFIEHLGRCIYGGIWAEMLEDRKFFFAVGEKESPWTPIGPGATTQPADAATVQMARDKPFVGEHSPQVRVDVVGSPRGLSQAGLGLRKGRAYVGRIVLAGDVAGVEIRLVWGDGESARAVHTVSDVQPKYMRSLFRLTAGGDSDDGRLDIVAVGPGTLRIGAVSLMPADHVHGLRADTLALLRELGAPIYRWPGGNFVSGYDWRDAIGDRDQRPPRRNPAWSGLEHHDFGIDEYMVFCREVNTEPYMVVNSGQGDAKLAAAMVEYANGAPDTPMGRRRAANGHREPYKVKYWGIGNEMYGDWQLGHMPLDAYVKKNNAFAEAMRAVDPSIILVAVGNVNGKTHWSERMLADCANHMDLLSEHFYVNERRDLVEHVGRAAGEVRRIAEAHRTYRRTIPALAGKDIRIALDEWNYWYGKHVFGELGTRYFLRDALGVAAALHEFFRNSDLYAMANYAQTVNVIGAIKTTKTAAAFETTGLVLKLYRQRFGVVPIAVRGDAAPLDVTAAWTADRKAITIGVVNPTSDRRVLKIDAKSAALAGEGRRWCITGPDDMAYNEPGKPPAVTIEETPVRDAGDRLDVPPISVCVFSLAVK